MKKLILLLCVIAGLYGSVGNTLVDSGTKSIQSIEARMAKAGV